MTRGGINFIERTCGVDGGSQGRIRRLIDARN
ncbi:hypothetical protein N826_15385 [Skermanella aerolata KACC 11604]|nr:hypothetical protein N826_15385 [Skermanella aerolata KACC 11604]